jgi:hypothetical protein
MWKGKMKLLGIKYLTMVICGDFLGVVYLCKIIMEWESL